MSIRNRVLANRFNCYLLYLALVFALFLGLVVVSSGYFVLPFEDFSWRKWQLVLAATVAIAVILIPVARALYRVDKGVFWGAQLLLLVCIGFLFIADRVLLSNAPPWPARALHGVDPSVGACCWGRIQSVEPTAQKNNSWGQRDRERSLLRSPGVRRVAFVGDSYLEESSIVPLNLQVEELLAEKVEVLNFGVSATGPRFYSSLIRNVLSKIAIDSVVVFFYTGNDFYETPDVRRPILKALASPEPQSSTLGALFPGINYFVTGKYRYSTTVWTKGLHQEDQAALVKLQNAGSDSLAAMLAEFAPDSYREECREWLSTRSLESVFAQIMQPTFGLFRTYLFKIVCSTFIPERKPVRLGPSSVELALNYLLAGKAAAESFGATFSVAIVPFGISVDPAMQRLWYEVSGLSEADFLVYAEARNALKSGLDEHGIPHVDLTSVLDGVSDTYLKFDGHWSPKGSALVAKRMSEYLSEEDK